MVGYNACLQRESAYHSMISFFNSSMQEKGVPEIQKFSSVQFSYEWFGLGFTGVGLPSLARRARVPADSATLVSGIICLLTVPSYLYRSIIITQGDSD